MTVPSSKNDNQEINSEVEADLNSTATINIEKPPAVANGKRHRIAPKPPANPVRKGLLLICLVGLIYTLFGFFIAPLLITSILPSHLETTINRPVTIGSAQVNPFRFTVILKNGIIGAEYKNPNDKVDPLFSFGRLEIKLQPQNLLFKQTLLRSIHANSVFLHIVRNEDQQLNLHTILTQTTNNASLDFKKITEKIQQIDLKLSDAKLLIDDQGSGTTHTIDQIKFRLPKNTNKSEAPYFSASINGSPIEFGHFIGQKTTGKQSFDLKLKDINLPSYLNYLPEPFPTLLSKGKADLDVNITISTEPTGLTVNITGRGTAQDIWLNDGKENHNKIDSANFTFSADPVSKTITFHKLILENPEIHLSRDKDGQLFFPAKNSFKDETSSQNLTIETVVIKNGKFVFIDQNITGGFAASFNNINLSIDKNKATTTSSYALNCITNRKTRVVSQGTLAHGSWQIKGLLILNDLPLSAVNHYISIPDGVSITSGILTKLETTFSLNPLAKHKILALTNTSTSIKNLSLSYRGKEIVSIPSSHISASNYSQKKHTATLGKVIIQNGRFHLTPKIPFPVPVYSAETNQTLWNINNLSVTSSIAYLRDYPFQAKPQTIVISSLNATNLSVNPKEKATINSSLTLLKKASCEVKGTLQFNPLRGTLDSSIDNLSLVDIPPPLVEWLKPPLIGGTLTGKGQFTFPNFSYTGTTKIQDLKLRYGEHHNLLTINKLSLNKTAYTTTPNKLTLENIIVEDLFTDVLMTTNKFFNLDRFINQNGDESFTTPQISIHKIALLNSRLTFYDESVNPAFSYSISEITGFLQPIDSVGNRNTMINFSGKGDDQTSFSLDGNSALFSNQLSTDFKATIEDMPLTTLKAYIEPIIGYGLQGGLFTLELDYHENKGVMNGQTSLVVRHLTLKDNTESNKKFPDTVALLTNAQQRVELHIPLTGNTTDPSYTFQSAYGKKLRELFSAIEVSPYSAVQNYYGDQQKTPSHIIFIPGTSEIDTGQNGILETLQTIMNNRPLLHITIAGFSGSGEDRATLLQHKQAQKAQQDKDIANAIGGEVAKSYGNEFTPKINPSPVLPPKTIRLTKQELQDLATQRSERIKELLINQYKINADVLHIDTTPTVVPESETDTLGHRVDFILSSKPGQ